MKTLIKSKSDNLKLIATQQLRALKVIEQEVGVRWTPADRQKMRRIRKNIEKVRNIP